MNQVRVAALSDFSELVEALGGDPGQILLEHGLSGEFIQNASTDEYMPYEQAESILEAAAASTGCGHLGMLLGKKSGIKLLGAVGYLMLQAPQVDTALDILCRYFSFHVKEAAVVEWCITEKGYVSIAYKIVTPMQNVTQGVEMAIANLLSFFRSVHGKAWYPAAVNFSHDGPANTRPYRSFFGSNVNFSQEQNEVIFKLAELQKTIELGEPELEKILHKHLEQSNLLGPARLSDMVLSRIRHGLPLRKATINDVSAGLALHPRRLHRMLEKEGTSFTELVESTRQSLAMEKLQNSDISILRLALHLGYSDASAFTRAFKRWTGLTPKVWKVENTKKSQAC